MEDEELWDVLLKRGFLWQSYEIYGGSAGFYDYGPLGASIKRKLEDEIRGWFRREGFHEIETPTIGTYDVFKASGHVDSFMDPMTECKDCENRFRADHLVEDEIGEIAEGFTNEELSNSIRDNNIVCPNCEGNLTDVWNFNLMFETSIGPYEGNKGFMRPETAQGIFTSFKRLKSFARERLPFGIFQVGKAYRNEISPRNKVVRLREFTQAEVEIFYDPEQQEFDNYHNIKDQELRILSDEMQQNNDESIDITVEEALEEDIFETEMQAYYLYKGFEVLEKIGIPYERLRLRQQLPDERAHYSSDTWDLEAWSEEFGWIECAGTAMRTNYDLSKHQEKSGANMEVLKNYDEPKKISETTIKPDMSRIGPRAGEKAKEIKDKIQEKGKELLKKLEDQEKVDIKGFTITEEDLVIEEEEKEVHGENVIPYVLEPSFGVDRPLYVLIESAFKKEKEEGEYRNVFKFEEDMAPIEAAVFPLVANDEFKNIAKDVTQKLRQNDFITEYDSSGSIGRRYARMDEIGTPYCITIDSETLEDDTVTVRDRDTKEQERIKIEELVNHLNQRIY